MAIIDKGRVLFHGSPNELIAQARGQVWIVTTTDQHPDHSLILVSSRQGQDTTQYRVLDRPAAHYQATPVEPNLEDGYMWLMSRV